MVVLEAIPYLKSDMEAGREAKGEYLGVLWGHG
jgi:hypothetical protein